MMPSGSDAHIINCHHFGGFDHAKIETGMFQLQFMLHFEEFRVVGVTSLFPCAESFGSLHALGPACSITSPYESCAQHKETATFRWLSPFEKASGGSTLRRSPRNSGLRGKCTMHVVVFLRLVHCQFWFPKRPWRAAIWLQFSPRLRGLQESVPSQARVFCKKPDTYNMKYI